ncbi:hypothetical protein S40285_07682 [Stachybotrys chlorohalonatus IBT 40285]|uniref:Uncharacterized protein n=1 Tax=Stachybotrys chlorohalonatus (strain IBT 40285) TaxID=1283841 RepID=A0A084Q8V5_STAC4|nr:hypothetical protein S40285_07682 [Stachybotrys chlorohalonata IBT 40285]
MPATTVSLLTGAVFGTGLTLSGVASPQVIRDQFRLSDFHMLLTFLTASASSAAVFAIYNRNSSTKKIAPRTDNSYGWVGKFDGNVIGGAMVGLGMSLTGACPGTVLVQATAGIGTSRMLACSALLAGIAWVKVKPFITKPPATSVQAQDGSIMAATGWSAGRTIVSYETAMLAAIATALAVAPRSSALLHPVVGGLLIGFAQFFSVIVAQKPVGVSAAYEEFGKLFWNAVDNKKLGELPDSIAFACGLMAGSFSTMLAVPATREALARSEAVPLPFVLVGGLLLTFGARIAGGCTSGHGISGMATLGLSSLITVASMFGTATVSGLLLSS